MREMLDKMILEMNQSGIPKEGYQFCLGRDAMNKFHLEIGLTCCYEGFFVGSHSLCPKDKIYLSKDIFFK